MEFHYKARNKSGVVETDVLVADTRQAALNELRARGLLPIFLSEKEQLRLSVPSFSTLFGHVSLLDKMTFVKNLSVMIRAGVPLSRSLRILSAQTQNKYFQKVLATLSKKVEGGAPLSQSLAQFPNIFSGMYVSLVEVGEAGGNLDQNLEYLVTFVKRENDLVRKTKGALTYPLVVVATMVMVGIFMFIFVLPKLTSTFAEMNVQLPLPTRILIGATDIASHYGIFLLIGLAGAVAGTVYFLRTEAGIKLFDKATISVPVIKGISKKMNLARFTLTLGSLLRSSMQIVNALKICGRSLDNLYYNRAVVDVSDRVRAGVSLSDALEKYPHLFPNLLTQMIRVGEEAGTVEEILKEMGDYYEEEVDQIMKNMSSIIEPVLVVIIGLVVGVIAVALIMPIYQITQNI